MPIRTDRSDLPRAAGDPRAGWVPDEGSIFGPILIDHLMRQAGPRVPKERRYITPSKALGCARELSFNANGTGGAPMGPSGWFLTSIGKWVHAELEEAVVAHFGAEHVTLEGLIGTKVELDDPVACRRCDGGTEQVGVGDTYVWKCGVCDAVWPRAHRVEPEVFEVRGEPVPIVSYTDFHIHTPELNAVGDFKTVGGYKYKLAVGERGAAEGPSRSALIQAGIGALVRGADKVMVVNFARDAISVAVAQRKGMSEMQRFVAEWTVDLDEIRTEVEDEMLRMARINRLWHDEGLVAARRIPGIPVEISSPGNGGWHHTEQVEVDGEMVERVIAAGNAWNCGYCDHQRLCIELGPGRVPMPTDQISEEEE